MRRAVALSILVAAAAVHAEPGAVVLARRFGGKGLDHGWGIGFDRAGNIVLSGFGSDALDLGGGGLLARGQGDGVFAASYTRDGAHRWSIRLPLGASFYAGPLAVDPSGAALLTGDRGPDLFFRRVEAGKVTASFDMDKASGLGVAAAGGGVLIAGQSRESGKGFVEARGPDGQPLWHQELEGTAIAVVPAPAGDAVVAGSRAGDAFVERRRPDGGVAWSRKLGKPDFDESRIQLAALSDGGVLAAYTSRPLTVVRLAADGAVIWTRELEGMNVGGVAAGPGDEGAVSGDGRVTRLDAGGKPRWVAKLEAGELNLEGVAIDAKGRTCVTGWFAGTLRAGAKRLKAVPDGYDVLLVCLEP